MDTDILEFQYSDDCDFIICRDLDDSLNMLLDHLTSSLLINIILKLIILKTERKSIEDGATKLIDYKKLDSHLYSVANGKLRVKKKSNLAFHIMWKTWKCKDLSTTTRIKLLYNVCIIPILLYNISSVEKLE